MATGLCCIGGEENQSVVIASCKLKSHSVCYSCFVELIQVSIVELSPNECLNCCFPDCSGRYSLQTIRTALESDSNGSKIFRMLEEAEGRNLFIMQKAKQEVLL